MDNTLTNEEYVKSIFEELQTRNISHVIAVILGETEENYECIRALYGPSNQVHGLVYDLMKYTVNKSQVTSK